MTQRLIHHRHPGEYLQNPVADIAELRLVPAGDAEHGAVILVQGQESLYWYDHASTDPENLPDLVLPTGGVGAWKVVAGGGAGGGVSDHQALNNLQGGTASERYHLTAAEAAAAALGYRARFSQERVLDDGSTQTIASDEELIIEELDVVDGVLDVLGAVRTLPPEGYWRKAWSQRTKIYEGENASIGPNEQLIIFNMLDVEGDMDVRGDLIITGESGVVAEPKTVLVGAAQFRAVDGDTWFEFYDDVANLDILERASGEAGVGLSVVDLPLEAGNTTIGVRPLSFTVMYAVEDAVANDVTGTLLRVKPTGSDTTGSAAIPLATSLSSGQTFAAAHDTAAERGAIESHAVKHTLISPPVMSSKEGMRIRVDADVQALTTFKVYGAYLDYEELVWR